MINLRNSLCKSQHDDAANAHLGFFKDEDDFLVVDIGALCCGKQRGFFGDFAYYIRLFLDICDDFCVLELKTDAF